MKYRILVGNERYENKIGKWGREWLGEEKIKGRLRVVFFRWYLGWVLFFEDVREDEGGRSVLGRGKISVKVLSKCKYGREE